MSDTLVILPGFGQSALRSSAGVLWPPAVDGDAVIGKMKGPFMKLLFFRRDAGFTDTAASLFREYSAPLSFTDGGEPASEVKASSSVGMLGAGFPEDALKAVYGEKIYVFGYHFLRSPLENADALSAFLKEKEIGRADFLTLNFGADVFLAFLSRHTAAAVDRAVLLSPCFEGLSLVADAYAGTVTGDTVRDYLGKLENKTVASFREILKMVPADVFETLVQKLLSAAMDDVMLRSPGAWAAVEQSRLAALAADRLPSLPAVREKATAFAGILNDRASLLPEGAVTVDGERFAVTSEMWEKAVRSLSGER